MARPKEWGKAVLPKTGSPLVGGGGNMGMTVTGGKPSRRTEVQPIDDYEAQEGAGEISEEGVDPEPSSAEKDILSLIDQLEDLVAGTPRIPLTGKVILSEDDFYEIIDSIRAVLPEELKDAKWIIRERDRILEEARSQSDATLKRSRDEAEEMAKNAEQDAERAIRQGHQEAERLIRAASQESELMVRQAQKEAEEIRKRCQDESQRIIEEARVKAAQMTDENAIVAKAEREAQEILERAHQAAIEVHHQAREYAVEVLGKVEILLHRATGTVRQSREDLVAQIEEAASAKESPS